MNRAYFESDHMLHVNSNTGRSNRNITKYSSMSSHTLGLGIVIFNKLEDDQIRKLLERLEEQHYLKIAHHERYNTMKQSVTKCEQIKYHVVQTSMRFNEDKDENG